MLVASSLVGEDSSEWLICTNIVVTYVGKVVGGIKSFEVVLCWERSVGGIGKHYLENIFLVLTGFWLWEILFDVLCSSPVDGDCQRQTDAPCVLLPILFIRDASFWCSSLGVLQLLHWGPKSPVFQSFGIQKSIYGRFLFHFVIWEIFNLNLKFYF